MRSTIGGFAPLQFDYFSGKYGTSAVIATIDLIIQFAVCFLHTYIVRYCTVGICHMSAFHACALRALSTCVSSYLLVLCVTCITVLYRYNYYYYSTAVGLNRFKLLVFVVVLFSLYFLSLYLFTQLRAQVFCCGCKFFYRYL